MTWDEIQNSLYPTLEKLNKDDYSEIGSINFKKGIYVFYENEEPIYVGRSNRIKSRLKEHSKDNSTHFSASFAFLLSKHIAKEKNIALVNKDSRKLTREELVLHDLFKDIFAEQKQRVAKMKFKAIEIENSNFQAIFEIYASMQLNALHNNFDNH